jgi:hypothetical protein
MDHHELECVCVQKEIDLLSDYLTISDELIAKAA